MQDSQDLLQTINTSRKYTRAIFVFVVLLVLLELLFSFVFSTNQSSATIVVGGLLLALEGLLVFPCLWLMRQGQLPASRPAIWIGSFFIVGGIWFDVLATVWMSPNMANEGNSFIIFMRQNGLPLWSLYLVGFYAQAALTVISVSLWVAFVRHLPNYLAGLLALQPQSLLEYLKAAFGGNTWYAKTNHIQISRSYRFIWLPLLLQIAPLVRWELGLEWIGLLVPSILNRQLTSWVQGIGIFVFFLLGLVIFYYKNKELIQRFDNEFMRKSHQNLARSCLVLLVIFICGCCGLTALSIPSWLYITRPPDHLQATLTPSETAQVGQLFYINLEISNTGDDPLVINQIFLSTPGMPGIMESLAFVLLAPSTELQLQNINDAQYLQLDQIIAPGETKNLTLYFLPSRSGRVVGNIILLSGTRMLPLYVDLQFDEP